MGKISIFDSSQNKIIEVDKVTKTDTEWKKLLTPEQYRITTKRVLKARLPALQSSQIVIPLLFKKNAGKY